MKSKTLLAGLLVMAILLGSVAGGTNAATQDEIEQAITEGIGWLVTQQGEEGSWWWSVGHTGLAVVKLEDRAFELGYDPFDEAYAYSGNVIAGLDYIFGQAAPSTCCSTCVVFALGHNEVYNTGIAMMAIAASKAPDRVVDVSGSLVEGWTYQQVLQANVDYFACSQNPADGGWRYEYPEEFSDNSATGYAVLGLGYAEAPLYGFECSIPATLKNNLSAWIDAVQVDGETPHDGGSGYSQWDQTSNLLRAGNLIFEMAFVGDTPDASRMQRALDYVGRAWNDPDWSWWDMHSYPGWYGNPDYDGNPNGPAEPPEWWQGDPTRWYGWQGPHYQAMYCLMKGLSFAGVDTILVDSVDVDWYQAFADRILATRTEQGYWPRDYWGDEVLATEWALLTLERVAPPRVVPLDVKPGSCPNPLGLGSKGVLPVAILGTDAVDVTQIDPATVRLAGVSPLRWSVQDVAAPFYPFTDKADCVLDCTEAGPDGYLDLNLRFKLEKVVAALGGVTDGQCLVLHLTANRFDGEAIEGEDVVIIRDR